MKLQVKIYSSDEGFAVCAPDLPGCWSQGATREEAVRNIAIAAREYMDADNEPPNGNSANIGPAGEPALAEAAEICELELAE